VAAAPRPFGRCSSGTASGSGRRYPETKLAEARSLAEQYATKASAGIDPRQGEAANRATATFGAIVDQFIERYANILKNCQAWRDKPVREITKHDANGPLSKKRHLGTNGRRTYCDDRWMGISKAGDPRIRVKT
jgi:hypothetical protein